MYSHSSFFYYLEFYKSIRDMCKYICNHIFFHIYKSYKNNLFDDEKKN